jgi:hypothetical protein
VRGKDKGQSWYSIVQAQAGQGWYPLLRAYLACGNSQGAHCVWRECGGREEWFAFTGAVFCPSRAVKKQQLIPLTRSSLQTHISEALFGHTLFDDARCGYDRSFRLVRSHRVGHAQLCQLRLTIKNAFRQQREEFSKRALRRACGMRARNGHGYSNRG